LLRNIDTRFGVTVIFTPLLAIFYITIFQQTLENIRTIFSDKESLFFIIIFYPLLEEFAFRGFIQECIARRSNNYTFNSYLTLANVITSILFASIHFVHHHPFFALMTFFPSLLLGYFKEHYKHLAPSIFLHMYFNVWSLLIII